MIECWLVIIFKVLKNGLWQFSGTWLFNVLEIATRLWNPFQTSRLLPPGWARQRQGNSGWKSHQRLSLLASFNWRPSAWRATKRRRGRTNDIKLHKGREITSIFPCCEIAEKMYLRLWKPKIPVWRVPKKFLKLGRVPETAFGIRGCQEFNLLRLSYRCSGGKNHVKGQTKRKIGWQPWNDKEKTWNLWELNNSYR